MASEYPIFIDFATHERNFVIINHNSHTVIQSAAQPNRLPEITESLYDDVIQGNLLYVKGIGQFIIY